MNSTARGPVNSSRMTDSTRTAPRRATNTKLLESMGAVAGAVSFFQVGRKPEKNREDQQGRRDHCRAQGIADRNLTPELFDKRRSRYHWESKRPVWPARLL